MHIFGTCITCDTDIHLVESPTGNWWAHVVHPDDDHDATPDSITNLEVRS
jgi:hypothetical protein